MSVDHGLAHTACSLAARRGAAIGRPLLDEAAEPTRTRLRSAEPRIDAASDEIIAMGSMSVATHGGSIRTFSGGLSHESGWLPMRKSRRLAHWQGMAQRNYLLRTECDTTVEWAQSEARRFEFPLGGRQRTYTCDVEVHYADGSIGIVEIKRDARDLLDPDYLLTLAGVAEICRRCDLKFEIIFAGEIFAGPTHHENVELVSSRRFASVRPEHLRRLQSRSNLLERSTTYGALAKVLEPSHPPAGRAVIQALIVRRQVAIDLTMRLHSETDLTILLGNKPWLSTISTNTPSSISTTSRIITSVS